ncbi:MAG: hypothetical protein IIA49_06700 [Bacteroidetes bacterium]|nr:hypothetical protein [Bacteroidota bacterium]
MYVALTELGWDVESESDDGYKHVDLAISEAQMDIEVDGQHHNTNAKQALADIKRTYHSFRTGVFTLRIPNTLVNDQERLVETAKYLDKLLNERVEQLEKDRKDKKFASIGRFIFYILLVYAIINILQLL